MKEDNLGSGIYNRRKDAAEMSTQILTAAIARGYLDSTGEKGRADNLGTAWEKLYFTIYNALHKDVFAPDAQE